MTIYMPPLFRQEDPEALVALIESYAFGTLVSHDAGGLHVSHIPFLPEREAGRPLRLLGHVARANPHATRLEAAGEVLAIFHGPHAYVSPGWYQDHPAVPTWNYAVVHAHGTARMMDEAGLHDLLARLSSKYESGRPSPWRMGALPADYVQTMLDSIVGFEIEVVRLEGKFKLSQNRPREFERVLAGLEGDGEAGLAAFMRAHPPAAKG